MVNEKLVSAHYDNEGLFGLISEGLRALGLNLDQITTTDLSPVDEFHLGGAEGTKFVIEELKKIKKGELLDVGCGLGGPARHISRILDLKITGIDLTPSFVKCGNKLSEILGMKESVELVEGSALETSFSDDAFDAAYMVHVGMNIDKKVELFEEVKRLLKPESLFVIYDVMAVGSNEITYPVPWASNVGESAVENLENYCKYLEQVDFTVIKSQLLTDFAKDFIEQAIEKRKMEGIPSLGLHLLLGDTADIKMKNVFEQVLKGDLAPGLIVAQAP